MRRKMAATDTIRGYKRGLHRIPSFDSEKSWEVFRNEKGAAGRDKTLPDRTQT